ncbi:hypothetical protein FQA39_LY11093 [Lamprigera yunnana]|nr:hypothetical protein FQA39_LY11093 [Lamprigera yunnana]
MWSTPMGVHASTVKACPDIRLLDLDLKMLQATSGMLCSTELTAKADRNGLIGVECSCIHSSLRHICLTKALASHSNRIARFQVLESTCFRNRSQQDEESAEHRVCSFGNVKSALAV